jgi:hypothetical protein
MKREEGLRELAAMDASPEVAIVGAGPYGLSIAAHLAARGLRFRIFGSPMQTWRENMPPDMLLKSDAFATNLSDPAGAFSLKRFCAERGEPYDDRTVPVRLKLFIDYGLEFQRRMVPGLEDCRVTRIEKTAPGFRLTVDSGERVRAHRVILAVGITHYAYTPPDLAVLESDRITHTSLCTDGERFRGRAVTIVGAGASAMESAALLHEAGAEATVVARSSNIYFGEPPSHHPRSLWQRLRHPSSGIGPSLRSRIYCDAPGLFRNLPQRVRLRIVKRHLGPHAGWQLKQRVVGRVPLLPGTVIRHIETTGGGIRLTLLGPDGMERAHHADHVIAATGYRADVQRLHFLDPGLRSSIRTVQDAPDLTRYFESSVQGLYFVGVSAANTFGPMMRFAFGADYTARCLAKHLAASARRRGA